MDAGERLAEALAQSGPRRRRSRRCANCTRSGSIAAKPLTRQAAHRDEFAEAQAELLAAFVELRAGLAVAMTRLALDPARMAEEMAEFSRRMALAAQQLATLDVRAEGSSPRTEVLRRDKMVLWRYERTAP